MMRMTISISNQPEKMKTMKRNSLVSLGLIGIMTLAISGCNGFEENKLPEPSTKGNFVIMVAPETKTEMSENKVIWSENDKLNVFVAASGSSNYGDNSVFTYDKSSKDKDRFVGNLNYLPDKSNDWYVLYPYNSEIETPANTSSGAINIGCAAEGYQMQNGNDNMSHLTGQHFPLYGKTLDVSSAQVPSIELKQALSILRIHVTNKNSNPLTVKEVYFTGTEAIAGSFYIGFAGESATMESAGSTSNTAVLKVNNGTAISTNGSAYFYLAIKPFTAESGSTLTLAVNGYEKTLKLKSDVSFNEGKIRTLNFEAPADYYEKVTSAPADWSGQYLIVDETNEIVANGVWNSTKGIKSSDVTITNSRIESTATTDAYAVTISNVSESNYSVYFAETELYVGYSGSKNECCSYESLSNDNTNWTISMSDGAAILTNVAANTRVLRSNFGETSNTIIADNGPFRCYTGDTGNPAVLYKLVDNTVWVLKSIAINPGPTKTEYEEGECFDPTGMVLTATYGDYAGVKADKNVSISHNDLTFSPTLDTKLTTDVNEVTISFGGMSLTQAITVTEKVDRALSSIEVKTPPTKTTYTEGDNFDPSGLVITATYSASGHEDKTEDVTYSNETASQFSFDPTTDAQLTTSDASVTISYTVSGITKTTTQAITVNSASDITYYEKVTTAPSDWSGDYLIVYEVNSTSGYVLTGVTSNIGQYADVTIADGKIVANDYDSYNIEIAKSSSSYTMKMGSVYLAYTNLTTSKNNNLYTVENASDDGALWTLSVDDAQNVYNTSRYLRWNNNSDQYRFCCYTSGQKQISFYKLDDDKRQEAGMSWSANEATATYNTGNSLSFTAPTLTPGYATGITYESTEPTIATISNAGVVSITALDGNDVTVGSTTIKAIFAGDTDYKPQTVSYTLTVEDSRDNVATPAFSPEAGEVAANTVVSFTCTTNEVTYYYTIDGTTPTTASPQGSSVTIGEAMTVKVLAIKNGYKPSDVATASYTVPGGNDGSLEHPYTADEAYVIINGYSSGSGSEGSKYVVGKVVSVSGLYNNTMLTYYISSDGSTTKQIQVFRGKYVGNTDFSSADQVAVGDDVIVYGQLYKYNTTIEINTGNYIYSLNGKTKVLTAGSLSTSTNDENKQITVTWGAATGTDQAISYVVSCGSQSYNASAAGSHTFTMDDYGTYVVSVVASASDAVPATATMNATLNNPGSSTKDYYKLITNLSDITEGIYVVGALRSSDATNNFYFGKAAVNSGDWVVSDSYVTVAAVDGVRRFEIGDLPTGAVEFTFTGDNTNGFTISNSSKYLYYTASSNRKLAFATDGSTYKWKVLGKSSPLITGGVVLSAVGGTYTISENSTAVGAIRGYASSTQYRAIYLFKKVNE